MQQKLLWNTNIKKKIEIRYTIKSDLDQLPWLCRQYHNRDTGLETNYDNMVKEFEKLMSNEDYKFISAMDEEKLISFCSVVVNHDIVEKQKPILKFANLKMLLLKAFQKKNGKNISIWT